MKIIIGFALQDEDAIDIQTVTENIETGAPVKSVVQVRFPDISRCYAYYNDRFDLRQYLKAGRLFIRQIKLQD